MYYKKVWTCAIILIFILFFYTFSFAQNENIKGVQFKDGSIIYGRVIEINVNDIQFETKDDKIISINLYDVATFIKEGRDESLKNLSNARRTWEVGHEISYIQYEEPGVKEKGMMYGIVGSYVSYHNYIMLKAEGKFAYGQLDYDGSNWGSNKLY